MQDAKLLELYRNSAREKESQQANALRRDAETAHPKPNRATRVPSSALLRTGRVAVPQHRGQARCPRQLQQRRHGAPALSRMVVHLGGGVEAERVGLAALLVTANHAHLADTETEAMVSRDPLKCGTDGDRQRTRGVHAVQADIFVMGKRTDFGPFFEKNKILPELQTNDIGV